MTTPNQPDQPGQPGHPGPGWGQPGSPQGPPPGWGPPDAPQGPPPGWGPPGAPQGARPGWDPYAPTPPGYPAYPGYPAGPGPYHVPPEYREGMYGDPLVTPPGEGIGGWFRRVMWLLRTNAVPILLVLLVTQALPALVVGIVAQVYTGTFVDFGPTPTTDAEAEAQFGEVMGSLGSFFAVLIPAAILAGYAQSIGWGAVTWIMARSAVGERPTVGAALRYGLRRSLGLWGWSILSALIIGVGICACVLPGIYFAFALALVGPVYLFERRNPIGRSFGILHGNFGPVLGRLAIIAATLIVGSIAVSMIQNVSLLAGGTDTAEVTTLSITLSVLTTLLSLPLYAAVACGLVATYAEQRAVVAPVTSAQLAAELG